MYSWCYTVLSHPLTTWHLSNSITDITRPTIMPAFSEYPPPPHDYPYYQFTYILYHHQIGSMNYYPLCKVRSWNNGGRIHVCLSVFLLIHIKSQVKRRQSQWYKFKKFPKKLFSIKHRTCYTTANLCNVPCVLCMVVPPLRIIPGHGFLWLDMLMAAVHRIS